MYQNKNEVIHMKLVAVLGSSRPDSVSDKLAEQVMEGARSKGYETKVYHVNDMNLKGCRGCRMCRSREIDCIINDDMKKYFEDLRECEVLLVASPNYFSQVTGPMITFMNRHYCMSRSDSTSRLPAGKKLVGVFSQGAPEAFPRYETVYDWYLSLFERHMSLAGKIVAGGDTDLSDDGEKMKEAYALGASL